MQELSVKALRKKYSLVIAATSSLLGLFGLAEFYTAEGKTQTQQLPLPAQTDTFHKDIAVKAEPVVASKIMVPAMRPVLNEPIIPPHSDAPWHTVTIKNGDSLEKIFKAAGVDINQLQAVLNAGKANKALNHIKPGETMQLQTTSQHKLLQLKYSPSDDKMLWVQRAAAGFKTVVSHPSFTKQSNIIRASNGYQYAGGTIHRSLNEAAHNAGMSYAMTTELSRIFASRVNFRRIQPGDHFSVLYKNNKSGKPDILAAEFNSRGSNYQAIRYTDRNGHTSYYNPQGHSLSASAAGGLTRFPVQYKRISSYFSYRRYDPVLHRVHQHPGLDLAAPHGTPIKSIGEGRVKFIGRRGGYGNAVIVSYPNNYTALFGHMSQFPRGLRTNSVVHQGQVIGYVGSTGFATGPHVHYEVHVNGVPRDPLKVTLPPAGVIEGKDRLRFMNQAKTMLAQLQTSQRSQLAANNVNVKIKE